MVITDKEKRFIERNKRINVLFNRIADKNPKWRTTEVIKQVADHFLLSENTVEAILKERSVYKNRCA